MLYRPLFWTSYWCEDWLFSTKYRNAKQVLISSASSKTAFCLAYLIRKRVAKGDLVGIKVTGLTSKKNLAFTRGLSLYDEVFDYDSLSSISSQKEPQRWLYTDVAGNDLLNERIFSHFGGGLVASIALGLTNLSPSSPDASSTKWTTNTFGETPSNSQPSSALEQFFMPEWLNVRRHQLSLAQINTLQAQAWRDLMRDCGGWVKIDRSYGGEDVKKAYEQARSGLGPEKGQIWSLWEQELKSDPSPKL